MSISFDKDQKDEKIEEIIQKIISYRGNDGRLMMETYNIEFINNYLSRNLTQIEVIFQQYKNKKGIDIIDFLFQMLNQMDYNQNETLFITVALIDFFQAIIENENLTQLIKFQNITNFICENDPTFAEGVVGDRKIPTKKLPEEKKFDINRTQRIVREIDINPPILFKDDDTLIRRLTKEKNCIDSVHHNMNMIIASQYIQTLDRIITLDSYSDHFLFYNSECLVTKEIHPQLQQLKGQVCMDFFWSNKQQRLGASFRDGYLAFWEESDQFQYEKAFQIGQSLTEEQIKIWYIECIDKWVTTDKKNQLYIWDLEKELISSTLKSDTFAKGVLQLQEISYLKVVAVATCDNQIAIWDFINQQQLFRIEVDHSHLNQIIFFKTYQLILSAGYDNVVNVYSLHNSNNDYTSLGKLLGHSTLVTSIQCIENTPMVITADDRFNIKVWDIRNMKCIQNMNIDLRNSIRFIHILQDRICLISSRVTCLFFEDELSNTKAVKDASFPIAIEYDPNKKEMSVCSRKDVKYIDIDTGRVKKIISGLISSQEDEITTFRVFQQNRKFLVGNQKGKTLLRIFYFNCIEFDQQHYSNNKSVCFLLLKNYIFYLNEKQLINYDNTLGIIKVYNAKDGDLIGKIQGHNDEVSIVKMDYLNRLLTSASFDGNIYIQKELQNGLFEKLREIYTGKEIQNLDISVYHNLMIITFTSNEVYLINYEFAKLMAVFTLSQDEEPTCLEFISGYSIFIIGTSLGNIHFVQFKMHDDTIDLNLVAQITLNENEEETQNDEIMEKMENSSEQIADLLIGKEKKGEFEKSSSQKTQSNIKGSNSPNRKGDATNTSKQQLIQMFGTNSFYQKSNQKMSNQKTMNQINSSYIEKSYSVQTQQNEIDIPSKIMFDLGNKYLIVSLHNGALKIYDINSLFLKQSIQKTPHCNKKANYNAFRSSKEDFTKTIGKISQFKLFDDKIQKEIQPNESSLNMSSNFLANTIFLGSVAFENSPSSNMANSTFGSPKSQYKPRKSQLRKLYAAKQGRETYYPALEQKNQDPHFDQTKNLLTSIIAHKDVIQCLQFIDLGKKFILTSSLDCYIKIWKYPELTICGNLNIEHPLPVTWNIEIDLQKQYKTKLLYALQSIKCMVGKYGSQINHLQEKKFNFYNLYQDIMKPDLSQYRIQSKIQSTEFRSKTEQSPTSIENRKERQSFQSYINDQIKVRNESTQQQIEDKNIDQRQTVENKQFKNTNASARLMKEEYTVRDLIYDKIKGFYQEELKGPSLKHLNEMKKLYEAQQQQKRQQNILLFSEDLSYKQKLERIEERSKEYKFIATFLDEKYRAKIIEKPNADFIEKIKYVEELGDRLERSLVKKKRAAVVVLSESSNKDLQQKNNKKEQQKKMSIIQKKLRISPQKEVKDNSNNSECQTDLKKSKSDFRLTNSTSYNSFQQKKAKPFYQYANTKNLLDEQSTINYSELSKSYQNTNSVLEHGMLRKTETKCFSNILKKMDEKLKKSKGLFNQFSKSNYQNFITLSDHHSNEIRSTLQNSSYNPQKRILTNSTRLESLGKKPSNSSINTEESNVPNSSDVTTTFQNLYKKTSSRVLKKY